MPQAHLDRTADAVAPGRHHEAERAATFGKAIILQRRQLIETGDHDKPAADPNNPNWEAPPAVVTFDHDVELVGLMPHMHVRGKAARFDLEYPDGKKETILNVPRYDFNWQLWYDTSIKVPKGTTMKVYAWYDNSVGNKFNPNPNATVYYGDQTWEEMHFPSYGLVLDDPSIDPKKVVRTPLVPQRGAGN